MSIGQFYWAIVFMFMAVLVNILIMPGKMIYDFNLKAESVAVCFKENA